VELSAVFVVLASLVRWRHARRKAASQRSAVAVVASSSQS
jgi:hypothetical protein